MWTLKQLASFIGLNTQINDTVLQIQTDSRACRAGDLFVALSGDNFDGHDFVEKALSLGAVAAIVRQDFELQDDRLLRVADPKLALGLMAKAWCESLPVKKIAVTGSNGKTTVKEMLFSILVAEVGADAVHATAGNFNNDIGLPLTLLKLTDKHRFAVIEMGMNHFKEIEYLTKLTRPDVALVNNAMRAHLGGGFDSTRDIAMAKSEIFLGLGKSGVAILNHDDPLYDFFATQAQDHIQKSFGLSAGSDLRATNIQLSPSSCTFDLCMGTEQISIHLPIAGEHNIRNAAAAASAAIAAGISLSSIAAGLAHFSGVKGRLQIKQHASGACLIDDTYNANPDSMKAGLDVLSAYLGKRIFVMGDIAELGPTAPELHEEVGTYAKVKEIEILLSFGQLSERASKAFGEHAQHFNDLDALVTYVNSLLDKDTTVLIKGSRSMRMERVVNALAV